MKLTGNSRSGAVPLPPLSGRRTSTLHRADALTRGRADVRTVAASAMDTGLPNPQVRLTWLASVAAHGRRVFARRPRPSSAPWGLRRSEREVGPCFLDRALLDIGGGAFADRAADADGDVGELGDGLG